MSVPSHKHHDTVIRGDVVNDHTSPICLLMRRGTCVVYLHINCFLYVLLKALKTTLYHGAQSRFICFAMAAKMAAVVWRNRYCLKYMSVSLKYDEHLSSVC
jgi:hypothetical protein